MNLLKTLAKVWNPFWNSYIVTYNTLASNFCKIYHIITLWMLTFSVPLSLYQIQLWHGIKVHARIIASTWHYFQYFISSFDDSLRVKLQMQPLRCFFSSSCSRFFFTFFLHKISQKFANDVSNEYVRYSLQHFVVQLSIEDTIK